MVTKEKWITTNDRFVVFLDIMGFKDLVSRHPHKHVYNLMDKLSEKKDTLCKSVAKLGYPLYEKKNIYTTSFSDSIIFFSNDNSPESFILLTIFSLIFFSDAMRNKIPMKGAMAYGKMSVNKKRQIYFGQPLIDAFLLQEEVNYYGIVHHNSIDAYIQENKSKLKDGFLKDICKEFQSPLKSGNIKHRNTNWFSDIKDESEFNDIIVNFKTMTSGNPRKYIENTITAYHASKEIKKR